MSLGFGLVPAAIVERGCRLLTDWHVLKYHQAIQTVWRAGHDDWRLATITGRREPRAGPGPALAAGDAQSVQRPAIQGPAGRASQAGRSVSRDVLRRFADRRAAAGRLAILAAPAARRSKRPRRGADSRS